MVHYASGSAPHFDILKWISELMHIGNAVVVSLGEVRVDKSLQGDFQNSRDLGRIRPHGPQTIPKSGKNFDVSVVNRLKISGPASKSTR